jgi:hypothetical protein
MVFAVPNPLLMILVSDPNFLHKAVSEFPEIIGAGVLCENTHQFTNNRNKRNNFLMYYEEQIISKIT